MSKTTLPVIIKNYIRKDEQGENTFDFERIVPIGDIPDWYERRLEKWGTKWIGYGLSIGESTIDFFTAWTPPILIIRKLAELHPELIFRLEYYETGMAFRGIVTAYWRDGEVTLEDNNWNMTDKDFEELGMVIAKPKIENHNS
jgi:hypothetical protein